MWKPGDGPVPMALSVEEAAPVIGIGVCTLRKAMNDQKDPLPYLKIGSHRLVNMARVQEWLDRRTLGLSATSR